MLVADGAADSSRLTVRAAPDPMLRRLWGRAGGDSVQVTGDQAWAEYLRRMMAAVTQ